jgi:hypothetical protein
MELRDIRQLLEFDTSVGEQRRERTLSMVADRGLGNRGCWTDRDRALSRQILVTS